MRARIGNGQRRSCPTPAGVTQRSRNFLPFMKIHCAAFLLLPITLLAQALVASGEFQPQQLTDEFWAEGANFGDFNKDGKMDVVYGQWWFEGPEFKQRHEYQRIEKSHTVKQADGTEKTIQG